jgi:hypothetical protein
MPRRSSPGEHLLDVHDGPGREFAITFWAMLPNGDGSYQGPG